jgi:hypothetical protein
MEESNYIGIGEIIRDEIGGVDASLAYKCKSLKEL